MNNLFENKAAMEVADEEMAFRDLLEAESDVVLEALTTGENPFKNEDEVDRLIEEDEENDQLDQEIEDEDNNFAAQSKATEAEALTGLSFLNSLCRDTDDPITTKPGSIGQQSSAASFDGNFTDEFDDDNDPIGTKPGSVGQKEGTANHPQNYSDEAKNNNDPISTNPGSVGQKNSTAKDPALESALTFSELMGTEAAMESIVESLTAKTMNRKDQDIATLGIQSLDYAKVDSLIQSKDYDKAKAVVESWIPEINAAGEAGGIDALEAAGRLSNAASSLIIAIESQKIIDGEIAKGVDPETATQIATQKIIAKENMLRKQNRLDPAVESAIDMAIKWTTATEADLNDPEATIDGSVGQKTSAATSDGNYSDGKLDNNDPIKADAGSEGQKDSAASFDENHSGGTPDNNDPITGGDGSVGQKDSTAKDPASEAATALEELEELTKLMNAETDGMDDPDDF
jgi:hypothetical protein